MRCGLLVKRPTSRIAVPVNDTAPWVCKIEQRYPSPYQIISGWKRRTSPRSNWSRSFVRYVVCTLGEVAYSIPVTCAPGHTSTGSWLRLRRKLNKNSSFLTPTIPEPSYIRSLRPPVLVSLHTRDFFHKKHAKAWASKEAMNRVYDVFEVLPDGVMVWRATVTGHEDAIDRLQQVAEVSANEFRLMHLPTKTVIATINAKAE
jgi:hypothetical protein